MKMPTTTVLVKGQKEVIQAARILIEHQSAFSLKPLYEHDAPDQTKLFLFELTLGSDVPITAYDMALASRDGA